MIIKEYSASLPWTHVNSHIKTMENYMTEGKVVVVKVHTG